MSAPEPPAPPPDHPLQTSLRTAHRTVLGWLGVCALFAAWQWTPEEPMPDARLTTPAVVLALATVLLRRLGSSPVMAPGGRAFCTALAYACAASLGALAAWVAWAAGAPRTALVFVVGALFFCLPPPPRLPGAPPPAPHHAGQRAGTSSWRERDLDP